MSDEQVVVQLLVLLAMAVQYKRATTPEARRSHVPQGLLLDGASLIWLGIVFSLWRRDPATAHNTPNNFLL